MKKQLLVTVMLAFALSGCASAPKTNALPVYGGALPARLPLPAYQPGMFAWPANGVVVMPFGAKADRVMTKGIDISAEEGGPIRAAKSGRVVFCDPDFKGYGKTIILDHGNGYQTVYAYNSEILTAPGARVETGEIIARAGSTGRAKRPSLHFEVRHNGEPEDPAYFLSRR